MQCSPRISLITANEEVHTTARPAWAYSYALLGLTKACDQCCFQGIRPIECLNISRYISCLGRKPMYLTFVDRDLAFQPITTKSPIPCCKNVVSKLSISRLGYLSILFPSPPAYTEDSES